MGDDNLFYREREIPVQQKNIIPTTPKAQASYVMGLLTLLFIFINPLFCGFTGLFAILNAKKSKTENGYCSKSKFGIIAGTIGIVVFVIFLLTILYITSNPELYNSLLEEYRKLYNR